MSGVESSLSITRSLVEAFEGFHGVPDPGPFSSLSLDEAFEIQANAINQLTSEISAWKLGASTHGSRAALNLNQLFVGPIPHSRLFASHANLKLSDWEASPVEAEIAIKLNVKGWLDSDTTDPTPFVISVHPSFELPKSRFDRIGSAGTAGLIADFGASGGAVIGPGKDIGSLTGEDSRPLSCRLFENGDELATANSSALLRPPIELLAMAKHCLEPFIRQATDAQFVLLGGLTSTKPPVQACTVVADFGDLGRVSLSFD